MAPLKVTVPLPITARVCLPAGALPGCVPPPTALPWDDHWDEGPRGMWLPSAMLLLPCRCQALGLAGDLGDPFGLRRASSAEFTAAFVWGALKDTLGSVLLSLLSAHPEGGS